MRNMISLRKVIFETTIAILLAFTTNRKPQMPLDLPLVYHGERVILILLDLKSIWHITLSPIQSGHFTAKYYIYINARCHKVLHNLPTGGATTGGWLCTGGATRCNNISKLVVPQYVMDSTTVVSQGVTESSLL